jgi:hypothetical protein
VIAGIRDYIDARVKEVDSNLDAWAEDAFGNNSVTARQADYYYNLVFGSLTNERNSNFVDDILPVFIDVWSTNTSRTRTLEDFDNLYQKAFDIYKNVTCLSKLKGMEDSFTTIQLDSITPIEEDSSDSTFKMRIEFTIVKSFCY